MGRAKLPVKRYSVSWVGIAGKALKDVEQNGMERSVKRFEQDKIIFRSQDAGEWEEKEQEKGALAGKTVFCSTGGGKAGGSDPV